MQLVPVIITYDQTPYPITAAHKAAAGRMTQDTSRIFNRITKRSMRYTTDALVLRAPFPLDKALALGVRNASTTAWWDAWRVLRHFGLDEAADVFNVWHMTTNTLDVSGVGMPASPHQYDGDLDNLAPFDPTKGGIAANGGGQLLRAIDTAYGGAAYRYVAYYNAHEVGHSTGRHHTPHRVTGESAPYDQFNMSQSIMAYGYSAFAEGRELYGRQPNPMLATPDEIVTWRSHSIYEDMPERMTNTAPGWADDMILVRKQDAEAAFRALPASARARFLTGALSSELGKEL